MNILLCSESPIKLKAVQNIFPDSRVDTYDCSSLNLPNQPINSSWKCALRRLKYAMENTNNYDLYIAIESGLVTTDWNCREECYVIIDDGSIRGNDATSCHIRTKDIKLVQKIILDADHELGHSITFGEMLYDQKLCDDPKNWMKTCLLYDRQEMIESALSHAMADRKDGLERVNQINSCYKTYINFPKPGVVFHDLFGVLANSEALDNLSELLKRRYLLDDQEEDQEKVADYVVGMESRGFFGVLLAQQLGIGFIPIRKAGKLPGEVETIEYGTEYSRDVCQISKDIPSGSRVILFDDLIATGGSLKAGISLLEKLNCQIVDICVLKEVVGLREKAKATLGRKYTVLLK